VDAAIFLSVKIKMFRSGDQLSDPGFDVVESVSERRELLHGVLLPLVGGGPVPHWPSCRRSRFQMVWRVKSCDELFDGQRPVVRKAGVGLPGRKLSSRLRPSGADF